MANITAFMDGTTGLETIAIGGIRFPKHFIFREDGPSAVGLHLHAYTETISTDGANAGFGVQKIPFGALVLGAVGHNTVASTNAITLDVGLYQFTSDGALDADIIADGIDEAITVGYTAWGDGNTTAGLWPFKISETEGGKLGVLPSGDAGATEASTRVTVFYLTMDEPTS